MTPGTGTTKELALITGLSAEEVKSQYAAGLFNKPPESGTKTIPQIVRDNLSAPFNLVIGAIIIALLGFSVIFSSPKLLKDSKGLFAVAFFNVAIALIQEIRAKRALDKVNMLLIKEVTVVRDGVQSDIPHKEIVLGDVILVKRGDQVVVDGTVLQSNHMEIDESLLTGESVPIEKQVSDTMLSGSFCLAGNGHYVVTQLAGSTYAAKLTHAAQRHKNAVSPLQRSLNRIVIVLFFSAVMLCLLQVLMSIGVRHGAFDIDLVRKLATIMIGLVPQGLVLLASVAFAIGILRISKIGAVVQTFNAIESFANVQVICMDKTGTLTQNRMTVRSVTPLSTQVEDNALEILLGTYARLSSDKNATIRALETFEADSSAEAVFEFPFSSQRKLSVVKIKRGTQETVYVLGALEILTEQCDADAAVSIAGRIGTAGLDVYRNLLFGQVEDPENIEQRPDSLGSFRVRPLCILSLSDAVRADAGDVIRHFEHKNIRFKILSGDSATSVLATCRDIGWHVASVDLISGAELDVLDEQGFRDAVDRKTVFARLKPEHKLKIIRAIQAHGRHTAMIGDGVNDVPAIKQADLGIAMEEGSAITKEVADIILLKNQFTLLPSVFEEGGKIINSVSAAAKLFLTKNFLIIYLTLVSSVLLWEFPLTPVKLTFFNAFALGAPACIIALLNTKAERQKRFVLDLFSFVAISALVIMISGYVGLAMAQNGVVSDNAADLAPMVMYSIMVITSVVSFLIVAVSIGELKRWIQIVYMAYGGVLVLVYFLVANASGESKFVAWLKNFYEIAVMNSGAWRVVLLVSLVSSLVLVGVQKLRLVAVNRGT